MRAYLYYDRMYAIPLPPFLQPPIYESLCAVESIAYRLIVIETNDRNEKRRQQNRVHAVAPMNSSLSITAAAPIKNCRLSSVNRIETSSRHAEVCLVDVSQRFNQTGAYYQITVCRRAKCKHCGHCQSTACLPESM